MQLQAKLENPIDLSIGVPEELTPSTLNRRIRAIQTDKTVSPPVMVLMSCG